MKNPNLSRIQRVSGRFRLLLTVLIILIPIATLMYWLFFNSLPVGFHSGLPVRVRTDLPLSTLILGFMISLIPLSATLYGANNLKRLFGLYEKGIVFAEENVSCFRHIGYALLSWVAANFVYVMLISFTLNYAEPFGSRVVARFGSTDIVLLIIGAVILLVSWVMQEAVALEDEHAHTV